MPSPFTISLAVRDYECDLQGVVNNAVYQNYLEHARHEYLKAMNIDFAELTRQGTNLVVVRAELNYKNSLTSGDKFIVHTHLRQSSRLKFVFHQTIVREPEQKLMIEAIVTGVALNSKGKPFMPDYLQAIAINDID